MAEIGGGGEPFGALRAVARAGAAFAARIWPSANMALRSPRAAASLYQSAALASSRGTPSPLA